MQANNMVTPFVFAVFIKSIITICCFAVNFVYVVILFPLASRRDVQRTYFPAHDQNSSKKLEVSSVLIEIFKNNCYRYP